MSLRGKYCAPRKSNGMESCYTKEQLKIIATNYNKNNASMPIQIAGTKEQIWKQIDDRIKKVCSNEWCWLNKLNVKEFEDSFMPEGHDDQYQWLSTLEIRDVLTRYEKVYPEFSFLGPMPIDFCKLTENEICNINLKSCLKHGKTKIGMVFNTDPSTKPGKHWVSMFVEMTNQDPTKWEINYFDSFGKSSIPAEISELITILQQQNNNGFVLKLNCTSSSKRTCTNSVQHQQKGSECGVYSINFIVERLSGTTWEDFVIRNPLNDDQVNALRTVFFRPKGDKDTHFSSLEMSGLRKSRK
jgi:hypothetical protein